MQELYTLVPKLIKELVHHCLLCTLHFNAFWQTSHLTPSIDPVSTKCIQCVMLLMSIEASGKIKDFWLARYHILPCSLEIITLANHNRRDVCKSQIKHFDSNPSQSTIKNHSKSVNSPQTLNLLTQQRSQQGVKSNILYITLFIVPNFPPPLFDVSCVWFVSFILCISYVIATHSLCL